jgi:transposase
MSNKRNKRKFISPDRTQLTFLPPSVEELLPQRHLARFVVEVAEKLNMDKIYEAYGTVGAPAFDPRMLLGLIFYGYSTGVFSSRKIEAATYDSLAFRYISGGLHPDHDTIAVFRQRFLGQMEALFVEILIVAKAMKLVRVGNVNIDGTKEKANASKHSAMSYAYLDKLEKQFREEVARLMKLAEEADSGDYCELDIPEELNRREDRLAVIAEAKGVLEARARDRYEKEKQEYDEKMAERMEKEEQTGKKPRGRTPKAPEEGPRPNDQYNFTDPESRIMKTSDGFDQCYNAQAAVTDNMLIVGAYATDHCNDKEELADVLDSIPEILGEVKTATADAGYFSEEAVEACEERKVDAHIATGRQGHNRWLDGKLAEPDPVDDTLQLSAKERMRRKLKTEEGHSVYRLRKMTVEPVFGIIKEIIGFRRFSFRGIEKVNAEWKLVCSSYNLKRMFKLQMG